MEGKATFERDAGGEVVLDLLSPTDFSILADLLRRMRKDDLRDSLKDVELSVTERLKLFGQLDGRKVKHADVIDFLNTLAGQLQALLLSLQKSKKDASLADVDALGIGAGRWLEIVAKLAGLEVSSNPNPASATAETTTATGATSPMS